jgi:hypothetical protein
MVVVCITWEYRVLLTGIRETVKEGESVDRWHLNSLILLLHVLVNIWVTVLES